MVDISTETQNKYEILENKIADLQNRYENLSILIIQIHNSLMNAHNTDITDIESRLTRLERQR
jgi:archaellum component FlaC